ncbi:MAG TPA: class I SAM-dependent methyltransferase [Solirubrobacterales bacterium]
MPSPTLTLLATAVLHVPKAPERVLEVECGDGERTMFLAREFPTARVRGVDGSEEAIRKLVAETGLDPEGRLAFKRGKRRSLPFPDEQFDLVVQVGGPVFLREISRVLRPTGHLLYAQSASRWFSPRTDPRRLRRSFERHGFETVEIDETPDGSFYLGCLTGS